MRTKLRDSPVVFVSTALVSCLAANGRETAPPGGSAQSAKFEAVSSGCDSNVVEFDPFGGVSPFGQVTGGPSEKRVTGTGGGRAAWNFSEHVGLALPISFMLNNVRRPTPLIPGLPRYNFGQQAHSPALNIVYNLTRRGSRVQPYLTVGAAVLN